MKQKKEHYFELYLVLLLFLLVAILSSLFFFVVLGISALAYNAANYWIGGLIVGLAVLIPFGIPTFVLVKGSVKLFTNRLSYFKKYSHHEKDLQVPCKTEFIYNWVLSSQNAPYQTLSSVNLEFADKKLTRLVMIQSANGWFNTFSKEDGSELSKVYLRNSEPYLLISKGIRIWLWPPDDRDKPDSWIGKKLQKFDDWWKTNGSSNKNEL